MPALSPVDRAQWCAEGRRRGASRPRVVRERLAILATHSAGPRRAHAPGSMSRSITATAVAVVDRLLRSGDRSRVEALLDARLSFQAGRH